MIDFSGGCIPVDVLADDTDGIFPARFSTTTIMNIHCSSFMSEVSFVQNKFGLRSNLSLVLPHRDLIYLHRNVHFTAINHMPSEY